MRAMLIKQLLNKVKLHAESKGFESVEAEFIEQTSRPNQLTQEAVPVMKIQVLSLNGEVRQDAFVYITLKGVVYDDDNIFG